jgi:signal transduction histidine kinase
MKRILRLSKLVGELETLSRYEGENPKLHKEPFELWGLVRVETGETENEAIIAVSDSGIGIPESDLPYFFGRYYRTDKSRSRATGGSGIGLTIGKSIVEAHGGRIVVKSKVNRGSTFKVYLPDSQS